VLSNTGSAEARTTEHDSPLPSVYQICFVPLAERLSPDILYSSALIKVPSPHCSALPSHPLYKHV